MNSAIRHDWQHEEVKILFELPFNDLLWQAQQMHREHFDPNAVQISTLLSIKTGICPEDCAYCSQSVHNKTNIDREALMDQEAVLAAARKAKDSGATRFCMAAGWRGPKEKDFVKVLEMIEKVKAMGMETCVSIGMLSEDQAARLADKGLDYYNHNIDTSPEYYEKIISTRTFQDRLDTLAHVREQGIHVCSGGIMGMGETADDRIGFLLALANLPEHPQSTPLNLLVKIEGTQLGEVEEMHPITFAKVVAVARIMLPTTVLRLTAGRQQMSDELQALCFLAGANSIHYGEKLLTTPLPDTSQDQTLFARLGLKSFVPEVASTELVE